MSPSSADSSGALSVHFARRTGWDLSENELSKVAAAKKSVGGIFDLTVSNPTVCEFDYAGLGLGEALGAAQNLTYEPTPWGLVEARDAVAKFYADKVVGVTTRQIMLTSSTSEGYNTLFRLLCNVGDEVLVATPSYPLIQILAELADVKVVNYPLIYSGGRWRLDYEALVAAISSKTRAIMLVSPNNPTGSFLSQTDAAFVKKLAAERELAIICDEVFADYPISPAPDAVRTLAGTSDGPLTFTLNGLSKVVGLPQLKLGWITIGGDASLVREASARLEMIADSFLSVGTPVQNACAGLLAKRDVIQKQIAARVKSNLTALRAAIEGVAGLELMEVEGGWYAILQLPEGVDEEAFALGLLKEHSVLVHPGYYYGFAQGAHFVLGLLPDKKAFAEGVKELVDYCKLNSSC